MVVLDRGINLGYAPQVGVVVLDLSMENVEYASQVGVVVLDRNMKVAYATI